MERPAATKIDVMTLFIKSLRSPYTRRAYGIELERYRKFAGATTPDELLTMPQELVINYILKMDEDGKSHGSKSIALAALKHFYGINDVTFNWKKISKFLGEAKKTVEDRGYNTKEIAQLLTKCDERKRVVVLTLASTGMRLGGLAGLKMKDTQKTNNGIYRITVYAGHKEHYNTYCSLECTAAIDGYLEYRVRCGERITGESPFIRNQFDKTIQKEAENAKAITAHMIQTMIYDLLYDSGLRSIPVGTAYKRKEVMAVHGFRKFFATALNSAYNNTNPLMVEMLLGHDTGLTGVYTKPSEESREDFYLGGMDALTISDENRLRKELKEANQTMDSIRNEVAWLMEAEKKRQGVSLPSGGP